MNYSISMDGSIIDGFLRAELPITYPMAGLPSGKYHTEEIYSQFPAKHFLSELEKNLSALDKDLKFAIFEDSEMVKVGYDSVDFSIFNLDKLADNVSKTFNSALDKTVEDMNKQYHPTLGFKPVDAVEDLMKTFNRYQDLLTPEQKKQVIAGFSLKANKELKQSLNKGVNR